MKEERDHPLCVLGSPNCDDTGRTSNDYCDSSSWATRPPSRRRAGGIYAGAVQKQKYSETNSVGLYYTLDYVELVGAVDAQPALLLNGTDSVRYVPRPEEHEPPRDRAAARGIPAQLASRSQKKSP